MGKEKVFKTIDEQVDILEAKGLTITDREKTKNILLKENYFFISGYRHIFMRSSKENKFRKGTTFDELYALFTFDRKIRNIFFKNILVVENNIKSLISYQLSKKYGFKESDYLNPKNFTSNPLKERQVLDIIEKMRRQIRVNGQKHSATIHYMSNYGYIPLWILVKVLSFGITSELYSILKIDDQDAISSFYHIDSSTLSIYLLILSNYRNLCAHEDILYDHKTQKCIPNSRFHDLLIIPQIDDEYIYGKNDLFAVVIILRQLLSRIEFNEFCNELHDQIKNLKKQLRSINIVSVLDKVGFPSNWYEIKDIL